MNPISANQHVAVLIDGDNIPARAVGDLLKEVAKYGIASVRRIYGDWTQSQMTKWKECLLENSIMPIQQFAYTVGKNATDGAMIIDAMDLLYTGRFSSFCLVSSDSDFTRLAARIREQGVAVYGFGNRSNTSRALVAACNEFVYLDTVSSSAAEEETVDEKEQPSSNSQRPVTAVKQQPDDRLHNYQHAAPAGQKISRPASILNSRPLPYHTLAPRPIDRAARDGIREAISKSNYYEDNWVNLAEVGGLLVRISPDLRAGNYNFPGLKEFVEATGFVEVKMKRREPAPPIALARLKQKGSFSSTSSWRQVWQEYPPQSPLTKEHARPGDAPDIVANEAQKGDDDNHTNAMTADI